MGGEAHAGDYHVGDTLACAECHKRDFRISRQAGARNGMGSGLPHMTGHTLGSAAAAPGGS